jgi:methyl-accepting chemotaxis protein
MKIFRKRDIFVVDENFQFKYAVFFGISGLFVSLIIGLVMYSYSMAHDQVLLASGLNQSNDIVSFFGMQHRVLLVKFITASVIITLFMFLLGLVISNKIAGPVFSIRRNLKNIIEQKDFSVRFHSRKRDELKELVEDLNKFMDILENKNEKG